MLITINKNHNKDNNIEIDKSRDISQSNGKDVKVIVFGYPFKGDKWVRAEDVLELELKMKNGYHEDIDGCYSIIIFNNKNVKIIIDRYGIYNLFYTFHEDTLLISDNVNSIIKKIGTFDLNEKSIIQFINFGYVMGNHTHVKGVRRFEPGTINILKKDLEISSSKYWSFINPEMDKMEKELFADIFNKHMKTGLELTESVSLPITGGLDSRTILSACTENLDKVHCYTHGVGYSYDMKVAGEICSKMGIKHEVYDLDEKWIKQLPELVEEHAGIFNGMVNTVIFCHLANSIEKENGKGGMFLSGILSNEVHRVMLVNDKVRGSDTPEDVSRSIYELGIKMTFLDAFNNHSEEDIRNMLVSSIHEIISDAGTDDPVNMAEHYCYNIFGPNVAALQLKYIGKCFSIFNPFIQKDLFQAIPGMAFDDKATGEYHKHIVKKNNEYLASIPLASGDPRVGFSTPKEDIGGKFRSMKAEQGYRMRHVSNTLSSKFLKKKVFDIPLFGPADYPKWLREYHADWMKEILDHDNMMLKHLIKKDILEKALDEFLNQDKNFLFYFLTSIISLELWLRNVGYSNAH